MAAASVAAACVSGIVRTLCTFAFAFQTTLVVEDTCSLAVVGMLAVARTMTAVVHTGSLGALDAVSHAGLAAGLAAGIRTAMSDRLAAGGRMEMMGSKAAAVHIGMAGIVHSLGTLAAAVHMRTWMVVAVARNLAAAVHTRMIAGRSAVDRTLAADSVGMGAAVRRLMTACELAAVRTLATVAVRTLAAATAAASRQAVLSRKPSCLVC